MTVVRLSLVSHTNVGKTTLARTLLGHDVGEVRDAPHVTEFAEMHPLLETPEGDVLELWDTPGFGDTVRLVRRLRRDGSAVGWFLSEVWDRWRDRPFWATQQALRHVRDTSDVVLYLVNAAESPDAAGYVGPEMELMAWTAKPVLVLLNQLGAPREAAAEAADVERWRARLASQPRVRAVLAMDAFARCWVQEGVLLREIARALEDGDDGKAAAARRLASAWAGRRLATFDAAIDELASSLARTAAARGPQGEGGGIPRRGGADAARAALAAELDAEVRASTGRLLALHALDGRAGSEILDRVAAQVEVREHIAEGRAAILGGVVSGALAGLKADLATGGLTMGGGMLAGGLLGALGAAGVARGLNLVRGTDAGFASWSAAAMTPLVEAALLRYMAVAHFGRGRGDWVQGEAPPHWRAVVADAMAARRPDFDAVWEGRSSRRDNAGEADALARALRAPLGAVARAVLERLYPGAWPAADNLQK